MKQFIPALLFVACACYGILVEQTLPSVPYVDGVLFDITFEDGTQEGRLQWNSEDGTLEFGLPGGDVNLQIGQETLIRVVNKTGTTITNGSPVAISGQQGGRPTIVLADVDDILVDTIVGISTENIANNENGYITTLGLVRNVDTSDFVAGTVLYVSTNAGEFVSSTYNHPIRDIAAATVLVSNPDSGVLLANPRPVHPEPAYSTLYIHDGTSTNSLSPQDTYIIVDPFFLGPKNNITQTESNITIVVSGVYRLSQYISFRNAAATPEQIECTFHVNGEHQESGEFARTLGTGGMTGSASTSMITNLTAGDIVDLRMKSIGSTATVIIEHGQFTVESL